ncbi:helix-turn-helix domain-containing protein [Maribacter ulvicola]|uniref:AraC-type DNA-binding protein n=1 Tax=Maribacter ulvicola TaxID=228959 RepID=A0A1N6RSF9_9FLAO|nr:AraC family transcriptional regulator [Maribacter ulvicola]SIQ31755.1 AraC-type DNA-binding protein [Maribacter ulvicola]
MVKKRRSFTDTQRVDLSGSKEKLYSEIADCIKVDKDDVLEHKVYRIKERYGQGTIDEIEFEDVIITTLFLRLKADVVLKQKLMVDFVQLAFLIEGERVVSVANCEDIFLANGDSYMANIKSFHGTSKITGNKTYKEIKVRLSAAFLSKHGFINGLKLKGLVDDNLVMPITNEMMAILESFEKLNYEGTARLIFLKAKVFEMLAIQVSNYKNEHHKNTLQNKHSIKKLLCIQKRINENLGVNYSVADLAKEVGMNKTVLNREFLRIFGLTVHEYSINKKIEKAKYLLLNTDMPIYEIAELIGYKNATHFSAAFKRQEGTTPKKFKTSVSLL